MYALYMYGTVQKSHLLLCFNEIYMPCNEDIDFIFRLCENPVSCHAVEH